MGIINLIITILERLIVPRRERGENRAKLVFVICSRFSVKINQTFNCLHADKGENFPQNLNKGLGG